MATGSGLMDESVYALVVEGRNTIMGWGSRQLAFLIGGARELSCSRAAGGPFPAEAAREYDRSWSVKMRGRPGAMTFEALRSGATILLVSALLATPFAAAGVASEAGSKAEAVNHPSALAGSRQAARKLGEIMPRRHSARLLTASGKTDRSSRLFPLLLGISF